MLAKRIIARLDVKAPNLVKGIRLEGFRILGSPAERALQYDREGIDELLYVDIVASLYGRNSITDLVTQTAEETFSPLGVCGGIRSVEDADRLILAGAEKVGVNTAAVANPALITKLAERYGSQAVVLSVEAKRTPSGWEAYVDAGRERTYKDAVAWAVQGVDAGAGEVLLTSVDRDGTRNGMDLDLLRAVRSRVTVPVVLSGGAGAAQHVADAFAAGADGVAVASLLHYEVETVGGLKAKLAGNGIDVRLAA